MKQLILIIICIAGIKHTLTASENIEICNAAKDSAAALFERGGLGFYASSKMNPDLYNYIIITKENYKKTTVRISKSTSDTAKLMKYKLFSTSYDKNADKSQPLDTSLDYKKCYNAAFQAKLDSVFKCDFFRKSDSILKAYDKAGKGYSAVEFKGGPSALQKYLDKTIVFPKDCKPNDSDKAYRVYYSFFVDENGSISDINLIKSNCKACEASILEAIKKMPAFVPALEAGKPKKSKYILPYLKAYIKPKD